MLEHLEHNGNGDNGPDRRGRYTQALNAEEMEAAAVEHAERLSFGAVVVSEEAGQDGAECAVDAEIGRASCRERV